MKVSVSVEGLGVSVGRRAVQRMTERVKTTATTRARDRVEGMRGERAEADLVPPVPTPTTAPVE